jgi:hypothetical protein
VYYPGLPSDPFIKANAWFWRNGFSISSPVKEDAINFLEK